MLIDLINANYAAYIRHTATAKSPSFFKAVQPARYGCDTFQDMIEEIVGLETLLSRLNTHAT